MSLPVVTAAATPPYSKMKELFGIPQKTVYKTEGAKSTLGTLAQKLTQKPKFCARETAYQLAISTKHAIFGIFIIPFIPLWLMPGVGGLDASADALTDSASNFRDAGKTLATLLKTGKKQDLALVNFLTSKETIQKIADKADRENKDAAAENKPATTLLAKLKTFNTFKTNTAKQGILFKRLSFAETRDNSKKIIFKDLTADELKIIEDLVSAEAPRTAAAVTTKESGYRR